MIFRIHLVAILLLVVAAIVVRASDSGDSWHWHDTDEPDAETTQTGTPEDEEHVGLTQRFAESRATGPQPLLGSVQEDPAPDQTRLSKFLEWAGWSPKPTPTRRLTYQDLGPPRPTWYRPEGSNGPQLTTVIPWTPADLAAAERQRALWRAQMEAWRLRAPLKARVEMWKHRADSPVLGYLCRVAGSFCRFLGATPTKRRLTYEDLGPPRTFSYYPNGYMEAAVESVMPWTPEDLEREEEMRARYWDPFDWFLYDDAKRQRDAYALQVQDGGAPESTLETNDYLTTSDNVAAPTATPRIRLGRRW